MSTVVVKRDIIVTVKKHITLLLVLKIKAVPTAVHTLVRVSTLMTNGEMLVMTLLNAKATMQRVTLANTVRNVARR